MERILFKNTNGQQELQIVEQKPGIRNHSKIRQILQNLLHFLTFCQGPSKIIDYTFNKQTHHLNLNSLKNWLKTKDITFTNKSFKNQESIQKLIKDALKIDSKNNNSIITTETRTPVMFPDENSLDKQSSIDKNLPKPPTQTSDKIPREDKPSDIDENSVEEESSTDDANSVEEESSTDDDVETIRHKIELSEQLIQQMKNLIQLTPNENEPLYTSQLHIIENVKKELEQKLSELETNI